LLKNFYDSENIMNEVKQKLRRVSFGLVFLLRIFYLRTK